MMMPDVDVGPFLDRLTEPLNAQTLLLLIWYGVFYTGAKYVSNWSWAGLKSSIGLLRGKDVSDPFTLSLLAEIDGAKLDGPTTLLTPGGLTVRFACTDGRLLEILAGSAPKQERLDTELPSGCLKVIHKRAVARQHELHAARAKEKRETWTALLAAPKATKKV